MATHDNSPWAEGFVAADDISAVIEECPYTDPKDADKWRDGFRESRKLLATHVNEDIRREDRERRRKNQC